MLAKGVRSLNIFKVGTGLADTENIYSHVSKPLGILAGALDVLKALVFLMAVHVLSVLLDSTGVFSGSELLYNRNVMLLYGTAMLVGHCLPVFHKFHGGRGIFTYTGFLLYFVPIPMLIALTIAWLIVVLYKQIRFAQYVIVILPVLFTHVFYTFFPQLLPDIPRFFVAIIWAVAILMGTLNFIVSKKMGEI